MNAGANKIAAWAAALSVLYFVLSFGAILVSLRPNLPSITQQIFFSFALPALFLIEILSPLLKGLGLLGGGFLSFPTEGGLVLVVVVYAVLTYCVTFVIAEAKANKKRGVQPPQFDDVT